MDIVCAQAFGAGAASVSLTVNPPNGVMSLASQRLTLTSDFRQESVEKKTAQVQRLTSALAQAKYIPHREFFLIDNLLVRIHFIIVMIRWTGLAPWSWEGFTVGETLAAPAPNACAHTISTLEATQGQILSQSPTDATQFWWHLYGS